MGLYLEPNGNKGDWIALNGTFLKGGFDVDAKIDLNNVPNNSVLVCEIVAGDVIALAVIYDAEQYAKNNKFDGRLKKWFFVGKETAKAVAPMWDIYIKKGA